MIEDVGESHSLVIVFFSFLECAFLFSCPIIKCFFSVYKKIEPIPQCSVYTIKLLAINTYPSMFIMDENSYFCTNLILNLLRIIRSSLFLWYCFYFFSKMSDLLLITLHYRCIRILFLQLELLKHSSSLVCMSLVCCCLLLLYKVL